MNQLNNLHGNKLTESPIERNIQLTEAHCKPRTSNNKTSPTVLDTMWRLNYNYIDNGNVEVYPSEYILELTSDSIPDPVFPLIKLIDDDKMDHIL